MQKYMKIIRHGKGGTHNSIYEGADIVVMEKLDGANSSFKLEDGKVIAFSRNNRLDEHNNLRGFYQWTQTINPANLIEGVIYFGEWLVRHKLEYGEHENKFYLFDVFDPQEQKFANFDIVESEAHRLNLNLCPVFYKGEFQSLEHIMSFVGKSFLGKIGEGVVVKNYDFEMNRNGEQQFTKIVSDEFAEVKQVKKQRVSPTGGLLDEFVATNLTQARVSKILHKLVDEQILEPDYDVTDMGAILKNAGTRVYEDIIEEELDTLLKHVKSKIGKVLPVVVKEILSQK
ncbi:RNA ligase family protein [Bacillus sp. AG4(2022)]|uniref:RNA ligase family protein n=1 Tax=Bacillus sp. AG4(2022) TaxID=2962594 RepID=UPI002881027E|nr:RNA ligase family protein [Bacillus sp. AG4(2022)]MDT0160424.1 RNA ligase family protein [Bacillus sp. AG4(2022)]